MGYSAGLNNATGSNNIYLANFGASESNTIRIGSNQQAMFMAGVYGAATSGGQPVYVDSTGHLGTGGGPAGGVTSFNGRTGVVLPATGDYSFSLLSGTLASSQLTGLFSQPLTLDNQGNIYEGTLVSVTGSVQGNGVNSQSGYQIGDQTMFNADGNNDVMIGPGAGNSSMTGGSNQAIGRLSGSSLTTGSDNVFLGGQSGLSTTTGYCNVYLGRNRARLPRELAQMRSAPRW
ncbi:MAG: hypothetical protein WA655_13725 [Candidatus Korobacteraceae bacterium]